MFNIWIWNMLNLLLILLTIFHVVSNQSFGSRAISFATSDRLSGMVTSYMIHSLKLTYAPENRPGPKRKQSSSNHPFSDAKMLVLGRVSNENMMIIQRDPTHHFSLMLIPPLWRIFWISSVLNGCLCRAWPSVSTLNSSWLPHAIGRAKWQTTDK